MDFPTHPTPVFICTWCPNIEKNILQISYATIQRKNRCLDTSRIQPAHVAPIHYLCTSPAWIVLDVAWVGWSYTYKANHFSRQFTSPIVHRQLSIHSLFEVWTEMSIWFLHSKWPIHKIFPFQPIFQLMFPVSCTSLESNYIRSFISSLENSSKNVGLMSCSASTILQRSPDNLPVDTIFDIHLLVPQFPDARLSRI